MKEKVKLVKIQALAQSRSQKAKNEVTEKNKKLLDDLTKVSDNLTQQQKQCSNLTEQINKLEQKQDKYASIQRGLNAKVTQQEEQIAEQIKDIAAKTRNFDVLRLENESLASQYEISIDCSYEGDKVNVELVGALFKLYKAKKDELAEAEKRTNSTDEVKQKPNEKVSHFSRDFTYNQSSVLRRLQNQTCQLFRNQMRASIVIFVALSKPPVTVWFLINVATVHAMAVLINSRYVTCAANQSCRK